MKRARRSAPLALFVVALAVAAATPTLTPAAAQEDCPADSSRPVAAFSWSPRDPSTTDYIRAEDLSHDPDGAIVGWDWRGPLGGGSLQRVPGKQIADPGTYAVTLTVTDNEGCTDSITQDIVVRPTPPEADFAWEVLSPSGIPTTNDHVQFKDTSRDPDGRVVSWTWTPEGGTQTFRSTMAHRFPVAGVYNVTLVATDNHGAATSVTKIIRIEEGPRDAVAIVHDPPQPTPNTPVRLRAIPELPTGVSITQWTWLISDGASSSAREPLHQFTSAGPFQVRLIAELSNGETVEANHEVRVDPGLAVQGDAPPPPARYIAPIVLLAAVVAALLLIRTRNKVT